MSPQPTPESQYGFLSVVDLGGDVLIGGYLILNALGRPREFHCTEPIKPNRAQQILYGSTLRPFLYGDQIGLTLVKHNRTTPTIVCTDIIDVLSIRPKLESPMLVVVPKGGDHSDERLARASGCLHSVAVGSNRAFVHDQYPDDAGICEHALRRDLPEWDLCEPFERIHEAVTEIQKAA